MLLAMTALTGVAPAAELLQNGDFAAGMNAWSVPVALKDWSPLVGESVNLHPSSSSLQGYMGDVIYQPLNVPGAGGQTVTASLDLNKSSAPAGSHSLAVYVEYVDTSNVLHRAKAFDVDSDAVTNVPGSWTTVQGDVVLPPEARKVTKYVVAKQDFGSFTADNASLTSASLAPGTVPHVTNITGTGLYGNNMTVTGTGFGATTGTVSVGGEPAGYTVQSWADTSVAVLVQEPAQSGVVRLTTDFTESWGDFLYTIVSPTFNVTLSQSSVEVIKGSKAKLVVTSNFLNGFTSTGGVDFFVPENPGICTFSPVPFKRSGSALLTIDTSTLAAGIYNWTVQSLEASSFARFAHFTLRVSAVASAKFYENAVEITSLIRNVQGKVAAFSFDVLDGGGRVLPKDGCTLGSSNPAAVEAFSLTRSGTFQVIAQDEGAANVQVTAPDGFTATLPVTVAGLAANKVTGVGFTPSPVATNSGTSTVTFSALANPLTGVTAEGLFSTIPANLFDNGNWSPDNSSYSATFTFTNNQQAGNYLFYASATAGSRFALLQVVNSPTHGSLEGEIYPVDFTGPQEAAGTIEFYSPSDSSTPVATREIFNYLTRTYSAGAIPPGSYKVRFVPNFPILSPQWYPNAKTFADADTLSFAAGVPVTQIHFFPIVNLLKITQQPVSTTVVAGSNAQFQVVVDGGSTPYLYKWQKDQVDLTEGQDGKYSNVATDTLTITGVDLTDSGTKFRVIVTDNAMTSVTSAEATLTVGTDPPTATTKAPTFISATRTVLDSDVNAHGMDSMVSFLWGDSPNTLTNTAAGVPALVTGSATTAVSAELTGLTPNKTYHYRVRAENAAGTTLGVVMSFKTSVAVPPLVTTQAASSVTHNSAQLNGSVNARNATTVASFEYGTTVAYGTTVQAVPPTVTGSAATAVNAPLTGLLPHTKYHFRAKGSSDNGSANGSNLTFTTLNRAPVTAPDTFAILPSPATLNVLANDQDPDGDPLTIASFTQPAATAGTVTKSGANLVFTPKPTFAGGTFNYTVSDGFGGTHTDTVTLTVGSATLDLPTKHLLAIGDTYEVGITTSAVWSVTESLPWVSVTPVSGTGNGMVSITVQPNTTKLTRTGNIFIGGQQHAITQDGVLAPQISLPPNIPNGIVSGTYSLAIPTVNGPVTYILTGLPKGLKMDQSAGIIGGKPQVYGDFPVTVKAVNAAGMTPKISFTLHILATPASARGSFTAQIPRNADFNDSFGGQLVLTASSTGSLTGTLKLGATSLALPVTGQLEVPVDGSSPTAHVVIARKGNPNLLLDLILNSGTVGHLTGTVTVDIPGGASIALEGYRHPWTADAPAGKFAGRYTVAFKQSSIDVILPQGSGFAALTSDFKGLVTWAGKLADGTTYTGSTTLWPAGQIPMFQMLNSNKGSVLGAPQITLPGAPDLRTLDGTLSWLKKAQVTRAYADGFGPTTLDVAGGDYIPPEDGEIVIGLPDVAFGQVNATLSFSKGGIETAAQFASLDQNFRFTSTSTATFATSPTLNPANVKITSLNEATGVFSGTFTLTDPGPVSRPVTFDGVLLFGSQTGDGFFLLGQMPVPPALPASTPQLSGRVSVMPPP